MLLKLHGIATTVPFLSLRYLAQQASHFGTHAISHFKLRSTHSATKEPTLFVPNGHAGWVVVQSEQSWDQWFHRDPALTWFQDQFRTDQSACTVPLLSGHKANLDRTQGPPVKLNISWSDEEFDLQKNDHNAVVCLRVLYTTWLVFLSASLNEGCVFEGGCE